jgi:methionine salvage enolase-phosphatase E1
MPETYVETRFDVELKVKQLRSRIAGLLEEKRARRGLPPRTQKFLLDSIDELAAAAEQLAGMDATQQPGADSPATD